MTRGSLDQDLLGGSPAFKTAADFCAEYVPLSYILEPIVRTSALYTLTARTGSGKTALAIIAALAVATGRSEIIGMPVTAGRIAYLSFENPDDLRMRLAVAAHCLSVDLADVGDRFVILDRRETPEAVYLHLATRAAIGGPFALIIVDTLAAAFDGADLNNNIDSGNFVRRLRPLTCLPGSPAVLVAAHPTKNATDDNLVPYGGGAILNEVDGNLTLTKGANGSRTALHWQGKYRGLEFTPRQFRFEQASANAIVDKHGRLISLPMLRPGADVDRQVSSQEDVDLAILRCLACDLKPPLRNVAVSIARSKTAVLKRLNRLKGQGVVEQDASGQWALTEKGRARVA